MNRLSAAAPLLLAASAAGCLETGESSGLLLPDQVQVGWEAEYNGRDDGLGALVPVDVMVYDAVTGEPTPGVMVHVWTDDEAAMPVPVDGVTVLDADPVGVEVGPEAPADRIDPSPDVEAGDAEHDQFVALEPTDVLDLRTDEVGVARLYLYVDAFPEGRAGFAGGFAPVRVVVTLGDQQQRGSDAAGARGDADGMFWLAPR